MLQPALPSVNFLPEVQQTEYWSICISMERAKASVLKVALGAPGGFNLRRSPDRSLLLDRLHLVGRAWAAS